MANQKIDLFEDRAEITMKRGVAIIDLDEVARARLYSWSLNGAKYPYVCTNQPRKDGKKSIYMHDFILGKVTGFCIDHINANKLDNRKCNLRRTTHRQNCYNRKAKENLGLRYFAGAWRVRITKDRQEFHIGSFKTKEEAIDARIKAERELFGEFAPVRK